MLALPYTLKPVLSTAAQEKSSVLPVNTMKSLSLWLVCQNKRRTPKCRRNSYLTFDHLLCWSSWLRRKCCSYTGADLIVIISPLIDIFHCSRCSLLKWIVNREPFICFQWSGHLHEILCCDLMTFHKILRLWQQYFCCGFQNYRQNNAQKTINNAKMNIKKQQSPNAQ